MDGLSDSVMVVKGQITEPLSGSTLIGYDLDGTVSKSSHVSKPNARSESHVGTTFTIYSHS